MYIVLQKGNSFYLYPKDKDIPLYTHSVLNGLVCAANLPRTEVIKFNIDCIKRFCAEYNFCTFQSCSHLRRFGGVESENKAFLYNKRLMLSAYATKFPQNIIYQHRYLGNTSNWYLESFPQNISGNRIVYLDSSIVVTPTIRLTSLGINTESNYYPETPINYYEALGTWVD